MDWKKMGIVRPVHGYEAVMALTLTVLDLLLVFVVVVLALLALLLTRRL